MNIEQTFAVLRREQLLIDHAPHSVQFQSLTDSLLRVCSAAAVIPPLTLAEIRLYATLALVIGLIMVIGGLILAYVLWKQGKKGE